MFAGAENARRRVWATTPYISCRGQALVARYVARTSLWQACQVKGAFPCSIQHPASSIQHPAPSIQNGCPERSHGCPLPAACSPSSGNRPVSRNDRRSKNSICALSDRSSAPAQRCKASCSAGSRRRRNALRSVKCRGCRCSRSAGFPARRTARPAGSTPSRPSARHPDEGCSSGPGARARSRPSRPRPRRSCTAPR